MREGKLLGEEMRFSKMVAMKSGRGARARVSLSYGGGWEEGIGEIGVICG